MKGHTALPWEQKVIQALLLGSAGGTSKGIQFIQTQFNILYKIALYEEARNLRSVSLGRK